MKGSFDSEDLQAPLSEINMTPLVDVMLVLVVIFLVTAPMLNSAIKLDLPSESAAQITEEKATAISITKEGQYFLNDRPISLSELENDLKNISQTNPKQHIHIRSDVKASYGDVAKILGISQRLKLSNIAFVTEEK
jgi:biopolymer transport protein TolR